MQQEAHTDRLTSSKESQIAVDTFKCDASHDQLMDEMCVCLINIFNQYLADLSIKFKKIEG